MKKNTLLFACALMLSVANVFGQAREELNFGLVGVNYEIPVHEDVTIAPGVGTDLNLDWITVGVKANYYFDTIFEITDDAWDVYGGANAGYAIYTGGDNDSNDSGLNIGLQIGGRWFWNDKWGVYVELAGGVLTESAPSIGVTMKL